MTGLHRNPPQRSLAMYGCTKEQWLMLRDLGIQMIRDGVCRPDSTPLRAYQHQRTAALNKRGIEFKLSLMEWWGIWEASGHWPERGLGRGYMMCRIGDQGAYEVGNVFIGEGACNLSAAAKKTDLPIGVAYRTNGKGKPYRAYCNVYGRQRHIGCFASVEEAEQAYLKAIELDNEVKAIAEAKFDRLKQQVQRKSLTEIRFQAANASKARVSREGAAA